MLQKQGRDAKRDEARMQAAMRRIRQLTCTLKGPKRNETAAVGASINDRVHSRRYKSTKAAENQIIYTYTDEAPMLATYSLLPILRAFTKSTNIDFVLKDISVAGRILANFPDYLEPNQRVEDALAELGGLTQKPEANIIKLPNVSAAQPQLEEAIAELQSQGYKLPPYVVEPTNDKEQDIHDRYGRVIGSSVNPVLREGNSDRRVARPVKAYAQAHPHRLKPWSPDSKTRVVHMQDKDFFSSEVSHVMERDGAVRIEFVDAASGGVKVLRPEIPLQGGEVIDAAKMDGDALSAFFDEQIEACRAAGPEVLLSLHLKATMMKVSDPKMFGRAVRSYYKAVFDKHGDLLKSLGVNANSGLQDAYDKLEGHPMRDEVVSDIEAVYKVNPPLAMVDSRNGITNLHAPNDVIIDASVPPAIRDGGKMWNADDELADTIMMIPDRSYATMYSAIVEDCKANGAFDASTMGNVANVGLMAQKAEEYGSHDKTFEGKATGAIRVVNVADGREIFSHDIKKGDIWRMCQTKDLPIKDWVRLAVERAKITGSPAIFWLDKNRAHDAVLIGKVEKYLPEHDTSGLDVQIMAPQDAMVYTLKRVRAGENTISVTGNVLRDYLTDLFPILELGTSAKMLSIVPLLAGGGLFETGAGGSAPKHIQQLVKENHLRWDSLGEFLAVAVSIEDLANKNGNERMKKLGKCLSKAIGRVLNEKKSPLRKVHELDNRGSHFYLALFWAEQLAEAGGELGEEFAYLAKELRANESKIVEELDAVQGPKVDLGGYYHVDHEKTEAVMRPSPTLNKLVDGHASK